MEIRKFKDHQRLYLTRAGAANDCGAVKIWIEGQERIVCPTANEFAEFSELENDSEDNNSLSYDELREQAGSDFFFDRVYCSQTGLTETFRFFLPLWVEIEKIGWSWVSENRWAGYFMPGKEDNSVFTSVCKVNGQNYLLSYDLDEAVINTKIMSSIHPNDNFKEKDFSFSYFDNSLEKKKFEGKITTDSGFFPDLPHSFLKKICGNFFPGKYPFWDNLTCFSGSKLKIAFDGYDKYLILKNDEIFVLQEGDSIRHSEPVFRVIASTKFHAVKTQHELDVAGFFVWDERIHFLQFKKEDFQGKDFLCPVHSEISKRDFSFDLCQRLQTIHRGFFYSENESSLLEKITNNTTHKPLSQHYTVEVPIDENLSTDLLNVHRYTIPGHTEILITPKQAWNKIRAIAEKLGIEGDALTEDIKFLISGLDEHITFSEVPKKIEFPKHDWELKLKQFQNTLSKRELIYAFIDENPEKTITKKQVHELTGACYAGIDDFCKREELKDNIKLKELRDYVCVSNYLDNALLRLAGHKQKGVIL